MNIRVRKILLFRYLASLLLLISSGLSIFFLTKIIFFTPKQLFLDILALSLTIVFALGQIFLIMRGYKKESHLLDIAFNTDKTVNKVAMVIVIIGAVIGSGLDALALTVLGTRVNSISVVCSMLIIISISTYLVLNCFSYFIFLILFRKKELTLEDYAK